MTKLLVATSSQGSATVEVINFDTSRPNVTCANLPNLPVGLGGGTGILFGGTTPIICGRDTKVDFPFKCLCFKLENGNWKSMDIPSKCRDTPASVAMSYNNSNSESYVLTCGTYSDNFEVFNGQSWTKIFPSQIPQSLESHCSIKINSTLFLIIGGQDTYISKSTYFCDSVANMCYPGPDLNTARIFHACGTMNWLNPLTNTYEQVIVVVGGFTGDINLQSAELLYTSQYFTNHKGWIFGPSLTQESSLARMFDFENTVIIGGGIGGNHGTEFFQLASPTANWVQMHQFLSAPRNDFVMFLITDNMANC